MRKSIVILIIIMQVLSGMCFSATSIALNNAIKIVWIPLPGAASYNVYRDSKLISNVSGISYEDPDVKWGTEYKYVVAAVDGNGAAGPKSKEVAGRSGDTQPPESSLKPEKDAENAYGGKIYVNATSVPLTLIASDNPAQSPAPHDAQSGIRNIRIWEESLGEPKTSWQEIETEPNIVGPKEYAGQSVEIAAAQGERHIYSRAQDHNGNIQVNTGSINAIYDTEGPKLVKFEVAPKVTSDRNIQLKWSSSDNFSPLVKPEFTISPKPEGAIPKGFYGSLDASLPFQLQDKDGEYTIDFSVTDLAGNQSDAASETVILDRSPITGALTINDGQSWTDYNYLTLTYTANKPPERVYVYFSTDLNKVRNITANDPGWEIFDYGQKEFKIAEDPSFSSAPSSFDVPYKQANAEIMLLQEVSSFNNRIMASRLKNSGSLLAGISSWWKNLFNKEALAQPKTSLQQINAEKARLAAEKKKEAAEKRKQLLQKKQGIQAIEEQVETTPPAVESPAPTAPPPAVEPPPPAPILPLLEKPQPSQREKAAKKKRAKKTKKIKKKRKVTRSAAAGEEGTLAPVEEPLPVEIIEEYEVEVEYYEGDTETPGWNQTYTVYMRLKDDVVPAHLSDVISATIYYGDAQASDTTATVQSATAGEMIKEVKIDDKTVSPGQKLIMGKRPKFSARIVNDNGIDTSSIVVIDDFTGSSKKYKIDSFKTQQGSKLDPYSTGEITFDYTPPEDLPEGDHSIRVEAADISGNLESFSVAAEVAGVKIVGFIVPYPNPFKRTRDKEIVISYELASEGDIDIHIMNIGAEIVKRIYCAKGQEGGKTGKNKVKWEVKSAFGEQLGNGIYLGVIASKQDQKVLGKFKVVVVN